MRIPPTDKCVDEVLVEIDAAFAADSPARALELSAAAVKCFPKNVEVLRRWADALSTMGELDEACAAYRRALERAPDDLETLHAASELLVHDLEGDHDAAEEALGLLERAMEHARRAGDEARLVDLELLVAVARGSLGETRRVLEAVERARSLAPDDLDVLTERGIALFELCQLDEAKAQFSAIIRADASAAWPHYYLGLIAEYQHDLKTAVRDFATAHRLIPEEISAPVEISETQFDRVVEQALERLPERVRNYLSNVAIIVEELPDLDELRASEPPLSPGSLGMFRGTPVTEQSNSDPWSQFPSAILLFQRNLQRFAHDRDELVEQIGVTLVHEVGHFLGLDEEELYDRGLD